MSDEKHSVLQDKNGNTSSKRVGGFVAFGVAVILSVVALVWATNVDVAVDLVKMFLIFSGGLLGVGVAENFGKKS